MTAPVVMAAPMVPMAASVLAEPALLQNST